MARFILQKLIDLDREWTRKWIKGDNQIKKTMKINFRRLLLIKIML